MKKRALFVLVLACIGAGTWFLMHSRGTSDATGQHALEPENETIALAIDSHPSLSGEEPIAAHIRPAPKTVSSVRVRSREGFTLPAVELAEADGTWQLVYLESTQEIEAKVLDRAAVIRAPGHLPTTIDRSDREIVLDVDALLLVEGEGAKCVRAANMEQPWWPGPAHVLLQRLDEERYGIAASSDAFATGPDSSEFGVKLELLDGRTARLSIRLQPGMREHWTFSCNSYPERRPLLIRVIRPLNLRAGPLNVSLIDTRPPDSVSLRQTTNFGEVVFEPPSRAPQSENIAVGAESGSFWGAEIGATYSLVVQDQASKALGFARFVHDGTKREIEMRSPVVLHGIVTTTNGRSPPKDVHIVWTQRHPDDPSPCWETVRPSVRVDGTGRFSTDGPRQLRMAENKHVDPPTSADVQISAPGFMASNRHLEDVGAAEIDCGTFTLEPMPADLRLMAGEELHVLPRDPVLLGWESEGLGQSARIGNLRRIDERTMEVVLSGESLGNPENRLATTYLAHDSVTRALVPDDAVRLLHFPGIRVLREFARTGGGTFVAVPNESYDVEIRVEATAAGGASEPWHVTVTWHGLDVGVHSFLHRELSPNHDCELQFEGPRLGLALRYSDPNSHGVVALSPGKNSVRIPQ